MAKNATMLKFYRWLRVFAQKQAGKCVYCDIKCPHCRTWSSSISGSAIDRPWGYMYVCGQCLGASYWNSQLAPYPVPCDEKGNPK